MTHQTNQHIPAPTWSSHDYFLCSFLLAKGMKVVCVDGSLPRRRFVLHDPDPARREALILAYQLGTDDVVSANELFQAQRRLQRLLRDADG